MITDLVQQTIEEDRDEFYSSCCNCDIKCTSPFDGNNGYICSGHVRHPGKDCSFNVIRLCLSTLTYFYQYNFAPDEALEVAHRLINSVNDWMYNSPSYKKFRKIL